MQKLTRIFAGADKFSGGERLVDSSLLPPTQPIERGKIKIGRPAALTANQLGAAANIILQPRRQPQVIRVSPHLTHVKRQCRQQIGDVVHGGFNHQVG